MHSTKHRHSLTKSALGRRRKDRVPCPAEHSEASFFPPRRCTFARRKSPSRHVSFKRAYVVPLSGQWTNPFQIRPSVHDNGLPLCDVALFQTAAIANSLANKPAISREASQLKAASLASSVRSQAGSARSIRSRSTRTSTREAYEALTWRNRLRQQSVCHQYQMSIVPF
jgi:hypothetical protein